MRDRKKKEERITSFILISRKKSRDEERSIGEEGVEPEGEILPRHTRVSRLMRKTTTRNSENRLFEGGPGGN